KRLKHVVFYCGINDVHEILADIFGIISRSGSRLVADKYLVVVAVHRKDLYDRLGVFLAVQSVYGQVHRVAYLVDREHIRAVYYKRRELFGVKFTQLGIAEIKIVVLAVGLVIPVFVLYLYGLDIGARNIGI